MGKIKEIIDIRAGYSDTVDIQNDFKKEEENKKRMSTYRPIKSHRQAFEIIAEAPFIKDSYLELALLFYNKKDYNKVIYLCNKAEDIKNNNSYINEMISFDHTVYDLLSMSFSFTFCEIRIEVPLL